MLPEGGVGLVREIRDAIDDADISVATPSGELKWFKESDLSNGFGINNFVMHNPPSGKGKSLGFGKVVAIKDEFELTVLLVNFADSGENRWIDWRLIAQANPVEARISRRIVGNQTNHGEHFRLRTLSKSLQIWDMNTGALGRLDIDPLPHQLDVARKVVSAPQARFVLADDVGLGKTIEVGLILHALEQRSRCRRILIVCPASLTRQWKEEMRYKFARSFEIYNRDFTPEFMDEMRSRECVIVSLDLAKRDEHLAKLVQSGTWDVVIFDEAHRLGKGESGEQTDRYKLARALRDKTASLLLLTATPHQGKSKRFGALLELARPDLKSEIQTLDINPEIVGEVIIRNKKSKVTDAEGNLLFKGHDTRRFVAQKNEQMEVADRALTAYLRAGYRASRSSSDKRTGRAIGFVMSTYRKLASSSVAAILVALERRLQRLISGELNPNISINFDENGEEDDSLTENEVLSSVPAFFEDEVGQLQNLISNVRIALRNDTKLDTFLDKIVSPLIYENQNLLIFTEYRATQEYLREKLLAKFPALEKIELINGSMSLDDKMESVFRFNEGESKILISTEAGGEGLNLQKSCHVMVNYDLPWNPSRLVQRIGRLYRYGQEKRVQVLNLQIDDNFDNQALNLMMDRVGTMANDMAAVASENQDILAADILGELLSNIDMVEILERAETMSIERTEDEIIEAIENAKAARAMEEDILQFSSNFTKTIKGGFDYRHIVSFVEGMVSFLGIQVKQKLHRGKTLELQLPEEFVGKWPEFGRKSVVRLSVDQERVRRTPDVVPMDFECSFVAEIAELAQSRREFDGLYGESPDQQLAELISLQQVRWQGISGQLLEEELIPLAYKNGTFQRIQHNEISEVLLIPWSSSQSSQQGQKDNDAINIAKKISPSLEKIIKDEVSIDKMPSSVFTFAACRNSAHS